MFADADIGAAVPSLVRSFTQNAGQTCSAGSRLLVHASVHDEVVEKMSRAIDAMTVGRGLDDPGLGPLVSAKQRDRVQGFLDEVDASQILMGGGRPDGLAQELSGGAFVSPTIVAEVDPSQRIFHEEVFGPVVALTRFEDDDEALALANGTEYGLVSAVWTTNLSRAHRMAHQVEAGQVFVNTYGAGGGVELPFGGFKKSGYGREKSIEAFDEYTQTKTVVMKL